MWKHKMELTFVMLACNKLKQELGSKSKKVMLQMNESI
jgi:hypothetical protein